jgi:hypothetical protein
MRYIFRHVTLMVGCLIFVLILRYMSRSDFLIGVFNEANEPVFINSLVVNNGSLLEVSENLGSNKYKAISYNFTEIFPKNIAIRMRIDDDRSLEVTCTSNGSTRRLTQRSCFARVLVTASGIQCAITCYPP